MLRRNIYPGGRILIGNIRIGLRLHIIVVIMLVTLAAVTVLAVAEIRERVLSERQSQSRAMVASAISQITRYHAMAASGVLPEAEAQRQALEAVGSLQFGGDLYVWINDLRPVILSHPTPDLLGQNVDRVVDADGHYLFREFVRIGTAHGSGTVFYKWPRPGEVIPRLKVSYVEVFRPWGWMAGSGIYVDDVDTATRETAGRFALYALLAAALSAAAVWMIGASVTEPLMDLTNRMVRLAAGEDVEVPKSRRQDEIGELVRAMEAFKRHLVEKEQFRYAHDAVLREAHSVFNVITDAVLVSDARNHIKLVNPAFTRITGYAPDEVIGRNPKLLASGRHDAAFYAGMWTELEEKGQWGGEVWNRGKNGEIFPEWLSITVLRDHVGQLQGYVATFNNISERKRYENRIRWQAEHDGLTGLVNRAYFETSLALMLRDAHAAGDEMALLFIDLDGFKAINDSQGHAVGDTVLTVVAKRLHEVVRGNDLVARLGGDEFVVAIPQLHREDDALAIASKIVDRVSEVIQVGGVTLGVGASIGIAISPRHGISCKELLDAADTAMYRRKQSGRNGVTMA
ncbi:Methyl-accepting chemotaxis protein [Candidatus Terasakiella magnetica]|nr:Methyl-accepting chemotaxis protein [Candidatus Terasakiella magnetica]